MKKFLTLIIIAIFTFGIIYIIVDYTNISFQENTSSQLSSVNNSESKEISKNPSTGDSALDYFIERYNDFSDSRITPENTSDYELLHSWHGIYASSTSESRYQYVGIQFYYNSDNELKLHVTCRYYGNFDPYHSIIHNPKDISYNKIDDILFRDNEQSITLFGTTYNRIY